MSNTGTTSDLISELCERGRSQITHLEQLVAGVEIGRLLEGGRHGRGQHLVSGHRVS